MNERIKELAEQAGIVFWEISGDVDWRQANRENLEKFAELIVGECVNIIGEENYTMLTGKAYCVQLKRHFGVEE